MLEKFRGTEAFQIGARNEATRSRAHIIRSKGCESPRANGCLARNDATSLDGLLTNAPGNLRNVHEIAFRARIDDDRKARRRVHVFNDLATDTTQRFLQHGRAAHFLDFGRHLKLQNIERLALLFLDNRIDGCLSVIRLNRIANGNTDGILHQVLDQNALRIRDEFCSGPRTVALPNLLNKAARRSAERGFAESSREVDALGYNDNIVLENALGIVGCIAHTLDERNIRRQNHGQNLLARPPTRFQNGGFD